MLRLQKFDLQVSYKKGTEMYLADTLSRAYRVRRNTTQVGAEDVLNIENMRGNTERELESINMIQYLPVSEATQTAIREATEADATLRQLKTIIRQGWPASKEEYQKTSEITFPSVKSFQSKMDLSSKGKDWLFLQV